MNFSALPKNKRHLIIGASIIVVLIGGFWFHQHRKNARLAAEAAQSTATAPKHDAKAFASNPDLVGPRGNVPDNAPSKDSLKVFAIPVPGVLSRSEQPTLEEFQWLKNNGWKSVVDFREDGEKKNPNAVDSKLPGFNTLGFHFLSLPIKDGGTPNNDQADQFLKFVTDPANQPVHVHCAAGIGRTGIAVALYRYSVQSWPMEKAVAESSLYTKSISKSQQAWLYQWATTHPAGSYAK